MSTHANTLESSILETVRKQAPEIHYLVGPHHTLLREIDGKQATVEYASVHQDNGVCDSTTSYSLEVWHVERKDVPGSLLDGHYLILIGRKVGDLAPNLQVVSRPHWTEPGAVAEGTRLLREKIAEVTQAASERVLKSLTL